MKKVGILMPIFSLSNEFGIGTFGRCAFEFVDFLKETKQNCWQVLPLNQTSYGDSPYQSPSAYAGNPYFIDPQILYEQGLISHKTLNEQKSDSREIDYSKIFFLNLNMLNEAFSNFKEDEDYAEFCERQDYWLNDYSVFMSIKAEHDFAAFSTWDKSLRKCQAVFDKYTDVSRKNDYLSVSFWKFVQYVFFCQWNKLKSYANNNGIEIIGDMPIYVATDSVDVWANPENFIVDENLSPKLVAGVPPDAFSATGQLWGNPVYDWEYMKENGYKWWLERIEFAFSMYDMVRIDHFRGFESFYALPSSSENAMGGKWYKAGGIDFFKQVREKLGEKQIIAEDLGTLDDDVRAMLKFTGYPGMKVLQFAFDSENSEYLPENYSENYVAYTGTHDNTTLRAWQKTLSLEAKKRVELATKGVKASSIVYKLIKILLDSAANTVIIPIQDYLLLTEKARINFPSTSKGNWIWRLKRDELSKAKDKIAKFM